MCLKAITKTYIPPQEGEIIAWKIVEIDGKIGHNNEYWTPFFRVKITAEWLNSQDCGYQIPVHSYQGIYYSSGFHTYVTKAGADKALQVLQFLYPGADYQFNSLVAIPVKINQITYEGTDATCRDIADLDITTYVSSKIRLLTPEEASQYASLDHVAACTCARHPDFGGVPQKSLSCPVHGASRNIGV